jgi:hypothetical protein
MRQQEKIRATEKAHDQKIVESYFGFFLRKSKIKNPKAAPQIKSGPAD